MAGQRYVQRTVEWNVKLWAVTNSRVHKISIGPLNRLNSIVYTPLDEYRNQSEMSVLCGVDSTRGNPVSILWTQRDSVKNN